MPYSSYDEYGKCNNKNLFYFLSVNNYINYLYN